MAAMTGAILAKLRSRLGHSTVTSALRYQYTAPGRQAEIAAMLPDLDPGSGAVGRTC